MDATAAVCLTTTEWQLLETRLRSAPLSVYPLARTVDDGATHDGAFVTMFSQFQAPQHVLITTVPDYQQHGPGAKPHAVVTVYRELAEGKGIVLARVDVVSRAVLDKSSAQTLVLALAEMYLRDDRFGVVQKFNEQPAAFDFDALLDFAGISKP